MMPLRLPHLVLVFVALALTGCDDDAGSTTTADADALLEETAEGCGGATCSADQRCCDGVCVDVQRDALHCGACGEACEAGFSCDAGACVLSCQEGLTGCDGVCRDLASDDAHCGACGEACTVGLSCVQGTCLCPTGFGECNGDPSDGCETSLLSSAEHCGACDVACEGENAVGVCQEGVCELSCVEGFGDCDEDGLGCEVDLDFSNAHCGACGEVCEQGICQFGSCFASQQLAAGEAHSCAIQSGGRVYCWGKNDAGQLGVAEPTDRSRTPIAVPNLNDAIQVAVGGAHSCALNSSGAVICWGANDAGQLGDASIIGRAEPDVVASVEGFGPAVQISVGRDHSCALEADGEVWCWGENNDGRLGDDSKESRAAPVRVASLPAAAVQISAGGSNTCATLADGTVACWGGNFFEQLVDGTDTDRTTPVLIPGLSDIAQVHAGGGFMCAVHATAGVQCWGLNPRGQVGNGTSSDVAAPDDVVGLEETRVTNLDAGGSHTCAVVAAGTAKCWGSHDPFGELGTTDPSVTLESNVPVDVDDLTDVLEVATGSDHSCAMLRDQRVFCWGRNDDGQLGTGLASDTERPTEVSFSP